MASSNNWLLVAVIVALFVGVVVFGQFGADKDSKLRRDGVVASGRVIEARQTGSWVNNNPVVDLDLEVDRGGERYRATLSTMVPQVNLAAVQPGAVLRLRVAPDDGSRIVLDESWAR
ncbi:MAG: hypothetical protein KDH17_20110 [Rhodocyclaceae bacterium]|nr:hypothetical protein [Rhodocyclaceae bacterium]